ncbi:MAG: hypothetical protein M3186_02305 [Actinomycetota bacterium]|nr:hypothetical protein [Actinomycetota bacterium]
MPSSLIFAALAGAWLVVLVPMAAKRRQEVVRTAESALAARVLRRPDLSRPAVKDGQEAPMIDGRVEQQEPVSDERRYRTGRGGYDPEIAAQLARAKYVFRQRVVLGLVIGAGAALVLAYTVSSLLWWLHAALDVMVVGYLGYLRRQVRIEEEVRRRRAARLTGPRDKAPMTDDSQELDATPEHVHDKDEPVQQSSSRSGAASSVPHSTAVALDCDDEDPVFDELQPAFKPPYRRAVGE